MDGAAIPPWMPRQSRSQHGSEKTIGRDANQTPARGTDCDSRNYCRHQDQQSTITKRNRRGSFGLSISRSLRRANLGCIPLPPRTLRHRSLCSTQFGQHDYIKTALTISPAGNTPKGWALVFSAARGRPGASSRMDAGVCPHRGAFHATSSSTRRCALGRLAPGRLPLVPRGKRAHWALGARGWLGHPRPSAHPRMGICIPRPAVPAALSLRPGEAEAAPGRRRDWRTGTMRCFTKSITYRPICPHGRNPPSGIVHEHPARRRLARRPPLSVNFPSLRWHFSLAEGNRNVEQHGLAGLQTERQSAQSHARRATACLPVLLPLPVVADAERGFLISQNNVNFPPTGSPAFPSTGCASPKWPC